MTELGEESSRKAVIRGSDETNLEIREKAKGRSSSAGQEGKRGSAGTFG